MVLVLGGAVIATPTHVYAKPGDAQIAAGACTFSAPTPSKSGDNVTATAHISDCGTAYWTLTIQRHRTGPFWQTMGTSNRNNDGEVRVTTGCKELGTYTYRSILESNKGHQSVSGHNRFSC
ncbi:hypothetical protein [Polymorphospora lycopeni]|uniref:Ig-like domain-containing protein n=1 Tax=Polymorphospora lycopeni TaxID=3140240 RepID=A0ABV5CNK8_9ACTN